VMAFSELATRQLQRQWPVGVPGLKAEHIHSLAELDQIDAALTKVESDHSMPFGEIDPRKKTAPSDRWAIPKGEAPPDDEAEALRLALANHPQAALLRQWSEIATVGWSDRFIDRYALGHTLLEWANLEDEPAHITELLDYTLQHLGYEGLSSLAEVSLDDLPKLMSAALAFKLGTALLMFQEDGRPVVRFNVIQAQ